LNRQTCSKYYAQICDFIGLWSRPAQSISGVLMEFH
jgi:hypothetical protein